MNQFLKSPTDIMKPLVHVMNMNHKTQPVTYTAMFQAIYSFSGEGYNPNRTTIYNYKEPTQITLQS